MIFSTLLRVKRGALIKRAKIELICIHSRSNKDGSDSVKPTQYHRYSPIINRKK